MRTQPARPATTEYRAWAPVKSFEEEAPAFHVVAEFRYFQELLDYRENVRSHGADVVLTGPCGYVSVGIFAEASA